ncbi:MAG: iron ABC transporter permease [Stomatobaculum longum]|nr:iron ABC transporter permease [Stomatobaculum longum]
MSAGRGRSALVFLFLSLALLLLFYWNLAAGTVLFSPGKLWTLLTSTGSTDPAASILFKIRLPRALMALLLGGALAVSGFLLQTYFANPIAGPFVLGVSSGARLAVALCMMLFFARNRATSSLALVLAAFLGSLVSLGFLLAVSSRVRHMAALLVAGIMIGYICSAATDFLLSFAADSEIVSLHSWSQGSFSGMSLAQVRTAALLIAGCAVALLFLAKPLGAVQLGESYAESLGVNVMRLRTILILLASLLAATVTAFAGPVSFVGVAAPFLIQRLLCTNKPQLVLPASFLGGAVFCMASDFIARTAFQPTELALSTVTSFFGAPIVLWLLVKRRGK